MVELYNLDDIVCTETSGYRGADGTCCDGYATNIDTYGDGGCTTACSEDTGYKGTDGQCCPGFDEIDGVCEEAA
jgi:hypothetical protein